jgi:hypothetical protein
VPRSLEVALQLFVQAALEQTLEQVTDPRNEVLPHAGLDGSPALCYDPVRAVDVSHGCKLFWM